MIKDKGSYFQLDVIVEKFKKKVVDVKIAGKSVKDEHGRKIKEEIDVFVKDIIVPTTFYKESITIYGITLNDNYKLQKNKTTIYDKYSNKVYVVNHSVDELEKAKNYKNPVGFQLSFNNKK